jgi:hypothetical protein
MGRVRLLSIDQSVIERYIQGLSRRIFLVLIHWQELQGL